MRWQQGKVTFLITAVLNCELNEGEFVANMKSSHDSAPASDSCRQLKYFLISSKFLISFLLNTVAVSIISNLCHIVKCMAVTHHMVTRALPFKVTDETCNLLSGSLLKM